MNIVFLVSGGGGHLKYLYKSIEILQLPVRITAVVADRPCGAYDFAIENNIPAFKVPYSRTEAVTLREKLSILQPDLIITNIHKVLDAETLSLFPGKFINLHYSLLPAFGGLIGMKTLEEARKMNVGFIGATCHQVVETVDAGPVISQSCFRTDWEQPLSELTEIMFRSACLILIDSSIKVLRANGKEKYESALNIRNVEVLFNPGLSFDAQQLISILWPNNS
jgi:phosphoribosylglycinamide formyltransferase-1